MVFSNQQNLYVNNVLRNSSSAAITKFGINNGAISLGGTSDDSSYFVGCLRDLSYNFKYVGAWLVWAWQLICVCSVLVNMAVGVVSSRQFCIDNEVLFESM